MLARDPGTLGGSRLASWTPLEIILAVFVVIVVVLYRHGEPRDDDRNPFGALSRIGRGLTRLTGLPGWAAVSVGNAMFGLFVAGQGFYSDVAWHIALGRDDSLFTAPHTAILIGLVFILGGAVYGVIVATVDRVEGTWMWGGLRFPPALLPLGALGVGAVAGFPLDEIWHTAYGVDVTMWSPTHMLMILGASFTGLAFWLILAAAGLPYRGRWGRGIHIAAGWLALQGLVAGCGEFNFGVPQFPQIFHPLLISMAAGFALVSIRILFGPGRALGIAVLSLAMELTSTGESGPVATRLPAIFLASAVAVELVALLVGTDRRVRFALTSGLAIGTAGLAGEFWWNADAVQPWTKALLPEAVVVSVLGAAALAVLATGFVRAFAWAREVPPTRPIALAGAAVVGLGLIIGLLPRTVGDVEVTTEYEAAGQIDGEDYAYVTATLSPADAADDANWFQASAWQGGGLVVAEMQEQEPGVYRSAEPVPVSGFWKTLLRLHRGSEMMAAPIWFPADPTIDEDEIAAEPRTMAFASETAYLLRETNDGNRLLSVVVHSFLLLTVIGWLAAFAIAVRKIEDGGTPVRTETPDPVLVS